MDTVLEQDYFIEELQFRLCAEMDHLQDLKQRIVDRKPNAQSCNLAMVESGLQNLLDTLDSIKGASNRYDRFKRIRKVFLTDIRGLFKFVGVN